MSANDRSLGSVFGLGSDLPYWLSMRLQLEISFERLPEWLLPVADDTYVNLFAISMRIADFGSVWFWDHEEEVDEDEGPTEDNLTLVAEGCMDFLAALAPVDLE